MIRAAAGALDSADPLARLRDEFVCEDGLIYLDGNSLGRLPKRAVASMTRTIEREWGEGLVRSWRSRWLNLSTEVGDLLAPLIGAAAGEVLISDQTSVNLYKLASAALDYGRRTDIVSDSSNFPSDLYILEGVAASRGGRLRLAPASREGSPDLEAIASRLDADVGVVSLSHVDFRSGAVADMAAITEVAHEAGALALWDLSHSVGVLPVDLAGTGADLAVGCTYKYLNGGPGAPGFLFVRSELQENVQQPIHGWFGHADQFAFDVDYRPSSGIERFSVGTPPVVSLRGAEAGIALTARVGIEAIRAKSIALTSLLVALFDERLSAAGFSLISPRDPEQRGGHVGVAHPAAWQITQALLDREVVPDYRAPEVIRLGPSPLYTRFTDVWDAVDVMAEVVSSGVYRDYPEEREIVT